MEAEKHNNYASGNGSDYKDGGEVHRLYWLVNLLTR